MFGVFIEIDILFNHCGILRYINKINTWLTLFCLSVTCVFLRTFFTHSSSASLGCIFLARSYNDGNISLNEVHNKEAKFPIIQFSETLIFFLWIETCNTLWKEFNITFLPIALKVYLLLLQCPFSGAYKS